MRGGQFRKGLADREDLLDKAAVAKIKALVRAASTCFFCNGDKPRPVPTRPMSVQKVDDRGSLWFLSASDSHKNQELEADPNVQLMFQGSHHSDFLAYTGAPRSARIRVRSRSCGVRCSRPGSPRAWTTLGSL